MNYNRAIILGRAVREPQSAQLPNGTEISNFDVATNRIWKNKNGERKEETEYHKVVAYGRLAGIANQYLHKGSLVLVDGRLYTKQWISKDNIKRQQTEIIADIIQLEPKKNTFEATVVPAKKEGDLSPAKKKGDLGPFNDAEEDLNIPF